MTKLTATGDLLIQIPSNIIHDFGQFVCCFIFLSLLAMFSWTILGPEWSAFRRISCSLIGLGGATLSALCAFIWSVP
jgi:hypothetical protein